MSDVLVVPPLSFQEQHLKFLIVTIQTAGLNFREFDGDKKRGFDTPYARQVLFTVSLSFFTVPLLCSD